MGHFLVVHSGTFLGDPVLLQTTRNQRIPQNDKLLPTLKSLLCLIGSMELLGYTL